LSFLSLPVDSFLISSVSRLHANRKANEDWMSDLREAHAIFVATGLQGSVVSTHSLNRFIWVGHIVTRGTSPRGEHTYPTVLAGLPMGTGTEASLLSTWVILTNAAMGTVSRKVQRVCCLTLYGIHSTR
jgi:hypothetical protein